MGNAERSARELVEEFRARARQQREKEQRTIQRLSNEVEKKRNKK